MYAAYIAKEVFELPTIRSIQNLIMDSCRYWTGFLFQNITFETTNIMLVVICGARNQWSIWGVAVGSHGSYHGRRLNRVAQTTKSFDCFFFIYLK